jgi:hypothetical protein
MQLSNHPISAEELMAYLDGELLAGRSAEAEKHLAVCRECHAAAADFQSVSRRLSEWEVRFENDGLRAEVRRAVEARAVRKHERTPFRVQAWMWAIAPLVLVAILLPIWQRRATVRSLDHLEENAAVVSAPSADHAPAAPRQMFRLPETARGGSGSTDSSLFAVPDKLPADVPSGPLIVRTAEFTLTANDFPSVRDRIHQSLAARQGYIAD